MVKDYLVELLETVADMDDNIWDALEQAIEQKQIRISMDLKTDVAVCRAFLSGRTIHKFMKAINLPLKEFATWVKLLQLRDQKLAIVSRAIGDASTTLADIAHIDKMLPAIERGEGDITKRTNDQEALVSEALAIRDSGRDTATTGLAAQLVGHLTRCGHPMELKELIILTKSSGRTPSTVQQSLTRLVNNGPVMKVARGVYAIKAKA